MTLLLLINLDKMVGPFLDPHVLEFGSFLALSGLDLAPWQKVDLATLFRK